MADNQNREMTTLRLPPKVLKDSAEYAKARGWSRTRLVEELLTALLEGRLTVHPRSGPNPFPADELVVGPPTSRSTT